MVGSLWQRYKNESFLDANGDIANFSPANINSTSFEFKQKITGKTALYEKPYFPGPEISWKAQKDQVNIIIPSSFWLKRRSYFPSLKSSK